MRIESGDVGRAAESVDLAVVAAEVAEDARFEAGTRRCTVELRSGGPVRVTGTRTLLRSALENVVRNALRHTAEGSAVEVSVEVEAREAAREAVVRVRDHGPGLPAHQLERIFEPFYRVDDARTREAGGHGLGLAIARRAVHQHGGRIAAGLAPGGGLVVTIRLPAEAPAD
jgi:two-component system sensor histidine kinase CpxA